MARPFVAPVPQDRSVNEPSVIVSATQVLGFYNQENEEKRERVNETVKTWYKETMMKTYGWNKAEFSGNQCLLSAKVSLEK
ncbi:hypothetical protein [uncultured Selenomonas sp.]|mgnify:CR=1 FL=1|jgi:hypothetical protein|uniref:hypothetical protein n=1 Tax=uncultured Selenomonas sp. TaxID=159275 RepID=UPI00263628AF|nr:hypothetical protein [uncultured Selenomonas sp.]